MLKGFVKERDLSCTTGTKMNILWKTSSSKLINEHRKTSSWGLSNFVNPLNIHRGGDKSTSKIIEETNENDHIVEGDKTDENNESDEHLEHQPSTSTEPVGTSSSPTQRDLITEKADEFLHSRIYSQENKNDNQEEISNSNIPSTPQKLLHQIAKKIPPIQRSPDYLLKIRSASPQDAGLAAYAIGVIAGATDLYEKHQRANSKTNAEGLESITSDIFVEDVVKDRRWEQIVECVLCGVDVKKRMRELESLVNNLDENSEADHENSNSNALLEESNIIEGLDVADASRAAWGLSILCVHNYVQTLGGETPNDIMSALSLRCRDILNNQWKTLSETSLSSSNIVIESSITDNWDLSKKNLARDTARSMWAFACVKACTDVRSDYLLATCCNILQQRLISEKDFKKKKEEEEEVLDRLADIAEQKQSVEGKDMVNSKLEDGDVNVNETLDEEEIPLNSSSGESFENKTIIPKTNKNPLLSQHLSPIELANVIWALAVHNYDIQSKLGTAQVRIVNSESPVYNKNENSEEKEYDSDLVQVISNQIRTLLEEDLSNLKLNQPESPSNDDKDKKGEDLSDETNMNTSIDSDINENRINDEMKESSEFDEDVTKFQSISEKEDLTDRKENSQSEEGEEEILEVIDAVALLANDQTAKREIIRNSTVIAENEIETETATEGDSFQSEIPSSESEAEGSVDSSGLIEEDEILEQDRNFGENQADEENSSDLEVIDAASLLMGDENVEREILRLEKDDSSLEVSSDELTTEKSGSNSDSKTGIDVLSEPDAKDSPDNILDHDERKDSALIPLKMSFTSRDLCSIAWAVTQLQWRPSSTISEKENLEEYGKIINHIVSIFTIIGSESTNDNIETSDSVFQECGFSDVSNLAWAMAKYVKGIRSSRKLTLLQEANISFVTRVIAQWALVRLLNSSSTADKMFSSKDAQTSSDDQFVPPILSRLIWSLTTIFQEFRSGKGTENDSEDLSLILEKLSIASVYEAHANLSSYRAEDLARIVWAYSEFGASISQQSPSKLHRLNVALGRIQDTIESALLRWELGRSSKVFDESSIWNIPMFERTSSSVRLKSLESSRTSAEEEDNLDEDNRVTNSNRNKPGRLLLPTIRSLPIDPSTLCKVSFAFTKLSNLSMSSSSASLSNCGRGAEDLARVAARIFTYNGESLLSQCHPHDIARLCYSYTRSVTTSAVSLTNEDRSMCNSETREALTRHFTKRIVHVINDSSSTKSANMASSSFFDLMAPKHLASLIWSLGELGVQCGTNFGGESKQTSRSRRLRLSIKRPILSLKQLGEMSSSSTMDLLDGIIGLDDIVNDMELLNHILLDTKMNKLLSFSGCECCRAVHALTKLRNFAQDLLDSTLDDDDGKSETESSVKEDMMNTTSTLPDEDTEENSKTVDENNDASTQMTPTGLLNQCNDILSSLSRKIIMEIPRLKASQMRKILQAYHIMPFQADEMINAIETEVKQRLNEIEADSSVSIDGRNSNILSLIRNAADRFVDAASILSKSNLGHEIASEGEGEINKIQNEMEEFTALDESSSISQQISNVKDHMNRAIAAVCEAATRLERIERGALLDIESSLKLVEEGAAFELGRCLQLIDGYKLLEFESGTRRGRFTGVKRKNLGKRILSRLFQ